MGIISRKDKINATFAITWLSLSLGIIGLLALWTDRSLEFWFTHFKGEPVDIPYWLSLLVTFVFNAVILMANVISEVLRLFLG